MAMSPTTRRRATWVIAALVVFSLLAPVAATFAAPGDDTPSAEEAARARKDVASAAAAVAGLEVRLAELGAELDRAWEDVARAAEDYAESTDRLDKARRTAKGLATELAAAQADQERSRQTLVQIVLRASRTGGGAEQLTAFLSADGVSDVVETGETLSRLGARTELAVQQYLAAQIVTSTLKSRADDAVAEEADAAADAKTALADAERLQTETTERVSAGEAEREGLLRSLAAARNTSVDIERRRQEAADRERREREEREAKKDREKEDKDSRDDSDDSDDKDGGTDDPAPAPSRTPTPPPRSTPAPTPTRSSSPAPQPTRSATPDPTPSRTTTPKPKPTTKPKPKPNDPYGLGTGTSSGSAKMGRAAVAWAETQVGKPYGWGATGPNAYDCSGLTMKAWADAGVNLNRTSRDQFRQVLKISYDDLRPGDLVFWGSDTSDPGSITHVALWYGDGMILEAPRKGLDVRIVPMRWKGTMKFAGRP